MLAVHLKEADRLKQQLRQSFMAGEQDIIKAAEEFSDALLTAVNDDVSTAYLAEKQIEMELRNIERLLASNANQNAQWTALLDRLTRELKEMGDVSNWIEHLEAAANDINEITKKLQTE